MQRYNSQAGRKVTSLLHGATYTENKVDDAAFMGFGVDYLAYLMGIGRCSYISGHICFDERVYQEYGDCYDYVTVLRDPVKRWISGYHYMRHRKTDRLAAEMSIEEYADSEFGRHQGIAYVKNIGCLRADSAYETKEAIENAISNLGKFRIAGST